MLQNYITTIVYIMFFVLSAAGNSYIVQVNMAIFTGVLIILNVDIPVNNKRSKIIFGAPF